MNKVRVLAFVAAVFVFITTSCQSPQPDAKVNAVTMHVISFQTETMFNITCDKFDTYYSDKWHATTVRNDTLVKQFVDMLDGLKTVDDAYQPNVRAKLLLIKTDGNVDTVCMDTEVTRYKGKSYKTTAEFANFVLQQK